METQTDHLTRSYERIMTRLFTAIGANNLVFPLWLNPLFDRLVLKGHCRALNLFGRLCAGLYRQPRKRTAPRKTTAAEPPAAAQPAAAQPAAARRRAIPPLPAGWKWFTRALPSPMCEAARACAEELQQFLSEPAMVAVFETAPALRTHLRPLCRALGVTLPGEPKPPPEEVGPEPPPPPAVPRPMPEIGMVIHGRKPEPPPVRWVNVVRRGNRLFLVTATNSA